MKKTIVAAIFAVSCMATSIANATQTCRTNCYWIGDQQYCTTRCTDW